MTTIETKKADFYGTSTWEETEEEFEIIFEDEE